MKKRLTYDFVKNDFDKRGYILLSTEYKNNKQKLKCKCPRGHIVRIRYNNFKCGYDCSICRINDQKLAIEVVRKEFNKRGYTLISTKYIRSDKKLKYICSEGHYGEMSYDNFKQGRGCSRCRSIFMANKLKLDIKIVQKAFEAESYTLLTDTYINNQQKLKYVCSRGHCNYITYNHFRSGRRCPQCQNRINGVMSSKQQESIYKRIYGILPEEGCKNYNVKIGSKHIDIILNDLNIGIEYDSKYWHFESKEESRARDGFLVSKGWRILHILSGRSIPTRKELYILLDNFINSNNIVYYYYMSDWAKAN